MADSYTERFSEVHEVMAVEHADSQAAGAHATAWVYAGNHHRYVAVLDVGDMAATATLDMVVRAATSAAGTGTVNLAGKAITQLTQAGGDGNEIVMIEVRAEELAEFYDYIQVLVTVGTDAVEYSLILYGICPRWSPVALTNMSEVVD
jgi:hypothetical protein